jgi:methylenetetrahydrofolate dehydrogenase (NADP+) / methenyltetrahydrofolate cyclohydrolase
MARVLDGKWVRDQIKAECLPRVARLRALGRAPGLAVVLAGHDPASEIYVRNKVKLCEELGIYSEKHTPPETVTTDEIVALVESLNRRADIDGILVQLPLPKPVDAKRVLLAIAPEKDADGLHPLNLGNLMTGRPGPRPCTPAGVLELLKRYEIPISGRNAVVVGRSDLVGKPMAFLLLHENATVTMCHSKTSDLAGVCARADILVAAMGRPAFITGDFIKPGATVIDVGMNRLESREQAAAIFRGPSERTLVGDVHPIDVAEKAGAYTPVPGGVGLLTVAWLMVNTIESAERRLTGCSA